MTARRKVLVVDDEAPVRDLLQEVLAEWDYQVAVAETAREALDLLKNQVFDAAICDIRLPEINGIDLLRLIKSHDPSLEVLMMTGDPAVHTAVGAFRAGAYDYLGKPLIMDELRQRLNHVMEGRFLRQEVNTLRSRLGEQLRARDLVGSSSRMAEVKDLVVKMAAADSPVLIEGESGTGKELVAAAIHRLSARAGGPFISVNCGAVPSDLLESEFFGHVRGAFSGAVADALGLFRSAHGGSIFLDEIAELPPALQVKLLRALQEREVRPVGSARSFSVDVRVIAATNRHLDEAIRDGSLRQDLYYRLNVVRIVMPPLRDRKDDISALVTHFIRQLNQRFNRNLERITPEALAILMSHDFPGNVRELENLLERAYALGAREEIGPGDLPPLGSAASHARSESGALPTLAQAERDLILRALELHDNDRVRTARALGLSSRTLYRRLKEYGVI